MIDVAIKGMRELRRTLEQTSARGHKALATAMKVEGYRLRKDMQQEIRSGAPGGKQFKSLSFISQYRTGRKRRAKPLSRLAVAVRYQVTSRDPFEMHIGWVGKVSKSWKRLAEMHQAGFSRNISSSQRRWLKSHLGAIKTPKKYHQFFKLRKGTQQFSTPARPIIDPFWAAHQDAAWRNIRNNYRRKMAGERI